jgi:hypothetical protein
MSAQSPQASAPAIAEVVEDMACEMLIETSDLIESVNISFREAAFRRDHAEVRLRLGHLRLCVIAAIQTLNEMNGEQGPAP